MCISVQSDAALPMGFDMNKFFDDLVDDFLGGDEPVKPAPKASQQTSYGAVEHAFGPTACVDAYTPETRELYREKCKKCGGSGNWGYGRYARKCFGCRGVGSFERRTSPEVRAVAASRREDKKVATAQDNLEAFKVEHPAVFAWIEVSKGSFNFAAGMYEAVARFGSLTERQLAACERCIEKRNASRVAAVARVEQAPVVQTDKLMAFFDKALASALKAPKLRFELFTASLPKANSANRASVYLKDGSTYLGKIVKGRFFASREATPEQCKAIVETMADPLAQAKAYGRRTGRCCVCNRELSDPVSVAASIGPICASYLE